MKNETPEERQQRKAMYMARVMAHSGLTDIPEELEAMRKEAEDKFEEANKE